MDYVNLILQLFFAGILMYLILRVLDLELRLVSIEKVLETIPIITHPPSFPVPPRTQELDLDEIVEECDGPMPVINVTSEIDNSNLIEPQQFDSAEELSSRLKKMSIGQLADMASEKKIDIMQGNKKLTKKALINKLVEVSGM